ncbi:MAG: DUF1049 domain-containing protein [Deltaproteobacteria bacterium]|nr:DUF1049 domain-containing protein [Deltaproteobacteria bacterium]MBW2084917.1 DUF1049 domain-containing protein [Deltaproteobacteria bacterium]
MKKITILLWIVSTIIMLVVAVLFIIVNSSPAHVDLFFIEGDSAVFMVILVSFLLGFFSCLLFLWLRRLLRRLKEKEPSLIGEI